MPLNPSRNSGHEVIFKGCLHILLRGNREAANPAKEIKGYDGCCEVFGWLFCGFCGF
jgi:hypothetical protein